MILDPTKDYKALIRDALQALQGCEVVIVQDFYLPILTTVFPPPFWVDAVIPEQVEMDFALRIFQGLVSKCPQLDEETILIVTLLLLLVPQAIGGQVNRMLRLLHSGDLTLTFHPVVKPSQPSEN